MAFTLFLIPLILLFFLALFIFWIWALVDCVKRNFKKDNEKVVWVLVIVLAGFIGAIIYYFVVKRK